MTPAFLRARILDRAGAANVRVTASQVDQLAAYYSLLERWNRKINLTALPLATAVDAALDRLLMEPLIAAEGIEHSSIVWFDFGTGGGSPALPLKIMRPAANLTMVEVKERKAAFLREAVRSLGLNRASVRTARIETLPASEAPESIDLVTIRAVRLDDEILESAHTLLKVHGLLLMFSSAAVARAIPGFVPVGEQALLPSAGILSRFRKAT